MSSTTVDRILSEEPAIRPKQARTGAAPRIRKLKLRHPELSHADIAKRVGCAPSNVTCVLKTFMGKHSDKELRGFQEAKADIYDALQHRMLASLTEAKIRKAKPMEIITGAAILEDKARLVRGQATGISAVVLMDVVEALKTRAALAPNPPAIGVTLDGEAS